MSCHEHGVAGTALDEREVEVEDLEGRIANTEAALNTANARLEEEADSRAASSPLSPFTGGPEDAELEPQLPDITDKAPQRGTGAADDQAVKVEQLEELVAELQSQLKDLHAANTGKQTLLESAQVWPLQLTLNLAFLYPSLRSCSLRAQLPSCSISHAF